MASGSFNLSTTSGTTHLKSKINWSSTSNGSSANSSNVTASMVLWRDNSGYKTYGTGTFSITINGNTKSESKSYSFTNSETTILYHTIAFTDFYFSYELTSYHFTFFERCVLKFICPV